MSHEDFRSRLDSYVDGELSAEDTRRLEEHLETCADCRDELARLGALLDSATSLRERVTAPKRDLWPGILERIQAETGRAGVTGMAARAEGAPSPAPGSGAESRSGAKSQWGVRSGAGPQAEIGAEAPGAIRREPSGGPMRSRPIGRPRFAFRDLFRGRLPFAWATAVGVAVLLVWVVSGPPVRGPEASVAGLATVEVEAQRARSDLDAVLQQRGGRWPEGAGDFERNLKLMDEAIRDSRAALDADPRNQGLQRSILIVYQKQLDLLRWATRLVQQT